VAERSADFDKDLTVAKLEAKLRKIEDDVLFDKFIAEQQWKTQRIGVEKDIATAKKLAKIDTVEEPGSGDNTGKNGDDNDVNDEAQRIANEILSENKDDDDGIEGLFASLPQSETDPVTGKSQTVVTSTDGTKIIIRDYGKWTGVKPTRILEEACRSR
jgi:ATP-dependent RNA helicase DHX29